MVKYSLISLWILFLFSCKSDTNPHFADTIVLNTKGYALSWDDFYTEEKSAKNAPIEKDKWKFDAEAIGIKDRHIVFVGKEKDRNPYIGSQTKIINAQCGSHLRFD